MEDTLTAVTAEASRFQESVAADTDRAEPVVSISTVDIVGTDLPASCKSPSDTERVASSSSKASCLPSSAPTAAPKPSSEYTRSSVLELAQMIRRGDSVVFVTGSGLSAPSGIPTFRGEGGVWAHWVLEWGTRQAFLSNPRGWWDNFWIPAHVVAEPGGTTERQYEPTGGHYSIAAIAARPQTNVHVITQNIDGLHERAGLCAERLVEVHGRSGLFKCCTRGCRYAHAESISGACCGPGSILAGVAPTRHHDQIGHRIRTALISVFFLGRRLLP
jgi:hypothetical protein